MICSFCTANKAHSNGQLKWKPFKYQVRIFTINYIKHTAEEKQQQITNLENQLKILKKKVKMRMIISVSIIPSRMN